MVNFMFGAFLSCKFSVNAQRASHGLCSCWVLIKVGLYFNFGKLGKISPTLSWQMANYLIQ
uniref:Uncharacterized protein n=1 Tax=Rhizophora mucronata TaxID=61149 RepID=A0A2P2LVJ2_RHIMU